MSQINHDGRSTPTPHDYPSEDLKIKIPGRMEEEDHRSSTKPKKKQQHREFHFTTTSRDQEGRKQRFKAD